MIYKTKREREMSYDPTLSKLDIKVDENSMLKKLL